jgi:lipopolysaccharide transport system permease protein
MQDFNISPKDFVTSFFRQRQLIFTLAQREIAARYKGSVLGLLWSFVTPLILLGVYTFVFSVVFNARWGASSSGSKAEFALVLYAGLLIFNLFAECLSRAPSLVIDNPNYVKKVLFPLEILPWVSFLTAIFNTVIGVLVLTVFHLAVFGIPPATFLLMPVLLLPMLFLTLGLSWFLSSLGVYLRDVSQFISIITTALMFLTPIFYPISALPESFQSVIYLNPLTFLVDQARNLMIFGHNLNLFGYLIFTLVSLVISWLGFAWFQKTRKGFADVL